MKRRRNEPRELKTAKPVRLTKRHPIKESNARRNCA